jgi:AAA family ATP:ADP antiporter
MGNIANSKILKSLFSIEPHERLKFLLLTITFFFIVGAYTIIRELKDSIFVAVVGRTYIPTAKLLAMIVLVPAILLYSFLVDRIRRYQLLYVYTIFYGIFQLIFAVLLAHSTIGLANTDPSPYRIFGWLFYFFVEGFVPFVVSVFWAFANSVTDPDEAKKNYGLMVSGSKLGGMLSAALAWTILSNANPFSQYVSSDIARHQLLLGISALMLLAVPMVIKYLMQNVSGKYMHGYEAAYQLEKQRVKVGEAKTGLLSGLYMFIKYPYLLGIFCMVFFYEIIGTVLSYLKVGIAQSNSASVSEVSSYLFQIIFYTHLLGFIISLLGTKTLLSKLGERLCLILIPVATGVLIFYFLFNPTPFGVLSVFVVMKAINYGFSYPVRESLYIPTVKEIKFKSKSWIDAFGTKFAKTTGSAINGVVDYLGPLFMFMVYSGFFAVIIGVWVVAAYLLGKRFEKAVSKNEVIGAEQEG